MKRVRYAGGSFVTSDDTAEALIRYATALGQHGRSDSLEIPSLLESGERDVTSVLIGPSSEMMTEPLSGPEVDLSDAEVVARLRGSLDDLSSPPPVMPDEQDHPRGAFPDLEVKPTPASPSDPAFPDLEHDL